MKPNYFALVRHKLAGLQEYFRIAYYKFLGMRLAKGVSLGKIDCAWPNKVLVGIDCEIANGVVFKGGQPFLDSNYIKIGDRSFIGNRCFFNCTTMISIGQDCLIASDTTFADIGHGITLGEKINKQATNYSPIIIQDDVWIGTNCVILQGVTIGRGSVIGAGSMVNKSIPEYQIWAGSPARFIKNR